MKAFLLSSAMRGLAVVCTLAASAAALSPLGCTTSDQVLAWEESLDDGGYVIPDAGKPPYTPACGNGVRDEGEACDDNNLTNGDGCSSTCTVEPSAPQVCPGTVLPLTAVDASKWTGSVTGDTSASSLTLDSPTCGGGNGKDVVYAVTSPVQGLARVRLEAGFDALLYVRTACADPQTEVTCKAMPVGGGKLDISFPMSKDQTAYVVVDGVAGTSGTFKLDVEVAATSCGDGVAQYPEQCDDGNTTNGDGCSAVCQLEATMAPPGMCPGASYTLVGSNAMPTKVSFAGDIALLKHTIGGFGCSGGSGPDQVYAITPTISGSLTAELHASYPASHLQARSECFSGATELDCKESAAASVPIHITFPVEAQKTYFISADTDTSASKMTVPGTGLYTLDVTLSPPACANGVLDGNEECDDGNVADGDGCTATCTLEPLPAGIDTCPGAPITFSDGPDGKKVFRTTASNASFRPALPNLLPVPLPGVESCGTNDRRDGVYSFVAPIDGYLTAKAKATFNVVLDFRWNCLDETSTIPEPAGSIACAKDGDGDAEEHLGGAVNAGTTYYIVVESGFSNTNQVGVFDLDLEIRPSVCGNSVVEGGETCDDGEHLPGDGCDPDCQLEPTPSTRDTCTTAEPIPLVEGAPGEFSASVIGGNWNLPNNGTFTTPCGASTGNQAYFTVTPQASGVLVADVEATYNVVLGIRGSCPHLGTAYLACSNRSLGPGGERVSLAVTAGTTYWVIVDAAVGQLGRFKLDLALKPASCGDGILAGAEECDDGNLDAGDGCSATCTLEPLAGADTCPGYAVTLAGVGNATREKMVTISTAGLASHYSATCGGVDRDGVLAVTSDIGGTMVAQLTSAWPAVFYARSTCTDASSELVCKKPTEPVKPTDVLREITLPVLPNVPTYLFVDGLAGASGPATLSLTVTP